MVKSVKKLGTKITTGRIKSETSAVEEVESELLRTGENCSLYITKPAMKLLKVLAKSSRRSRSMIVSLFVEKYGPELEKNPGLLTQ